MSLPIFKSDSQEMDLMQTKWAQQLNPVLSNPMMAGSLIRNVGLSVGANEVNHKLGRKLQGYIITMQRGPAQVYSTQEFNNIPNLTLTLVSDADVLVDLWVF